MVTAWGETETGQLALFGESGSPVKVLSKKSIIGDDWQGTKDLASKYVGEEMAEAIASYFYFKTDQEAIDYLDDIR